MHGVSKDQVQGAAIDWATMRNRPLTGDEKRALRAFYDGAYQRDCDYDVRHPWHRVIATFRARVMSAVFPQHGKVLDAGCASGEVVSAFRALGIDCWGFDVCSDLLDTVYPEARPYVRMGRVDAMPYSASDGFETLVSYDVFEHVPVDQLENLPLELARLGIRQVACIIANDTLSPGHITIQELPWYEALFARAGFRLMRELTPELERLLVPAQWHGEAQRAIWHPYHKTGQPCNAWNGVPGHLFFRRD